MHLVKSVHTDDKLYEKNNLKCIIGSSMKQSLCSLKCYVWTVLKEASNLFCVFVCLFAFFLLIWLDEHVWGGGKTGAGGPQRALSNLLWLRVTIINTNTQTRLR